MKGPFHPDFLAAPRDMQHRSGSLAGLFTLLTLASDTKPPQVWAYRMLPSGALVSMKRDGDGFRTLRIARKDPFKTEDGPAKWENELQTFVRHFQIEEWFRKPDAVPVGVAEFFCERAPSTSCKDCGEPMGEAAGALPFSICTACGIKKASKFSDLEECAWDGCEQMIPRNPAYDKNHCQGHAIEAGRKYTAGLRAQQEA